MTIQPFPHLKQPPADPRGLLSWLRELWTAVNQIRQGKIDNVTEVTLTANVATTTLTDYRLSVQSVLCFMPTTANAAAELPTLYVGTRTSGSCIINHANNANADRTFGVSILG